MKIGVVTFWQGNGNYGMIMQCWALQKYLKDRGHEPFVIRYNPEGSVFKKFIKQLLIFIKLIINRKFRADNTEKQNLNRHIKRMDVFRRFDDFRSKELTFSSLQYHYIEKLQLFPPHADCYISGSDQIWRGSLKYKNISAFFLNFGSQKIRRIAYAPSFGLKDYYKGEIYLLKQALKRYNYLSCREFDGVKICKQAGYEVEKVVDPTLLLDESDYRKLLVPLDKRDYVFIYSLNLQSAEDIFWSDLKIFFDNTHRVVTPANGYFPGKELFEDVDYKYSTPYEWLSLIYNSKLVVTSSFHGVVFSIIFNKKFAFVPLKGKLEASNNRVLELLDLLDLNNTIINNGSDYVRILSNDIDWNVVNDRRKVIVEKSKLFLTDALKH